jgi:hypothetical protein
MFLVLLLNPNVTALRWREGRTEICLHKVRFEVFTAVTVKDGVFWDVMPCGSCKTRRFGGT